MTKINSRTKGAQGEREFCEWLQENFNLSEKPTRNLLQVREGGGDVEFPPFMFEVKRCQVLSFPAWWRQVSVATDKKPFLINGEMRMLEPVVCFRQNGKPWEFLISANLIGVNLGYLRVTELVFKKWAKAYISRDSVDHLRIQASEHNGRIAHE
jgi:hypothetical protein